MKMYAFKQKSTGRLVTGTNFKNIINKQIFSEYHPPILINEMQIDIEIRRRGINLKYYKVVEVEVKEVRN